MVKIVAMLLSYKHALKTVRHVRPCGYKETHDLFEYEYQWMYHTLTGPIGGKG